MELNEGLFSWGKGTVSQILSKRKQIKRLKTTPKGARRLQRLKTNKRKAMAAGVAGFAASEVLQNAMGNPIEKKVQKNVERKREKKDKKLAKKFKKKYSLGESIVDRTQDFASQQEVYEWFGAITKAAKNTGKVLSKASKSKVGQFSKKVGKDVGMGVGISAATSYASKKAEIAAEKNSDRKKEIERLQNTANLIRKYKKKQPATSYSMHEADNKTNKTGVASAQVALMRSTKMNTPSATLPTQSKVLVSKQNNATRKSKTEEVIHRSINNIMEIFGEIAVGSTLGSFSAGKKTKSPAIGALMGPLGALGASKAKADKSLSSFKTRVATKLDNAAKWSKANAQQSTNKIRAKT